MFYNEFFREAITSRKNCKLCNYASATPRRAPTRVALQARAVPHHGEVRAFRAHVAGVALHHCLHAAVGFEFLLVDAGLLLGERREAGGFGLGLVGRGVRFGLGLEVGLAVGIVALEGGGFLEEFADRLGRRCQRGLAGGRRDRRHIGVRGLGRGGAGRGAAGRTGGDIRLAGGDRELVAARPASEAPCNII